MAQHFLRDGAPLRTERLSQPARLMIGGLSFMFILGAMVVGAILYAVWVIDNSSIEAEIVRATVAYEVAADADAAVIAHHYSLAGARFVAVGEALRPEEITIPAGDGRLLAWTPRRLGTEVFMALAPMRLLACAAMLAAMGMILRRFYLLAKDLEARRLEARELADRDVLTGVSNRLAFDESLRASLDGGARLALLYIDLDDFKRINDTFGHGAGDTLLRVIAKRLSSFGRNGDLVARLGGDEFAMIVHQPRSREHLAELAQDVRYALSAPVQLDGSTVNVGACIGIAEAPSDANTVETLVAAADKALYRAKSDKNRSFAFAGEPARLARPVRKPIAA